MNKGASPNGETSRGRPAADADTARWRRLDHPAFEEATFERAGNHVPGVAFIVRGVVSGVLPDARAYDATYRIQCDADWVTRDLDLSLAIGAAEIRIRLEHDRSTGHWLRDGAPASRLDGALDVDLGFSPVTNSLPIRRLGLAVGEAASVRAAWLRFPELDVEPLEQTYRRLAPDHYRYESRNVRGETFQADLVVDARGIVTRYGQLWVAADPEPAA